MNVFISWSGDRSRAVAQLLDQWLPCVLQNAKPWLSEHLDRGSLWFSDLTAKLGETSVGIVCLTRENREAPWIMFEAGAIAKGLPRNRVCTLLVDLPTTEVTGPLAQFNHTSPDQKGLRQLLKTLNDSLGENRLKDSVLERVFEKNWPDFEKGLSDAIKQNPEKALQRRSLDDKIDEVLEAVRSLERRESREPKVIRWSEDERLLAREILSRRKGGGGSGGAA